MVRIQSNLNPLANAFVPLKLASSGRTTAIDDSTKILASKLVDEALISKRDADAQQLSDSDIFHLAEKLLSCRFRQEDPRIIKSYLATKLPSLVAVNNNSLRSEAYDFSVFKTPKPSPFLGHLWGLYDHETATRPTLSLTERPKTLTDDVWSVKPQDLKLWNTCSNENLCDCPPMFGYSLPIDFFNDRVENRTCSINHIHLNRYEKVPDGYDCVNVRRGVVESVWSEPLVDISPVNANAISLEHYSDCLKEIVSGVCELISETDEEIDVELSIVDNDDEFSQENKHELIPSLHFDDKDSILQAGSDETKKSCSHFDTKYIEEKVYGPCSLTPNETHSWTTTCDPPCSEWCHSTPDLRQSADAINLLKDTLNYLSETKDWLPSHGEITRLSRTSLKRSFSTNDCESLQVKMRNPPPATRQALKLMRKDPLNYFRAMRDRSDSSTDSDSGISSQWVSQEDICSEYSSDSKVLDERDEKAPMWNLFSGEGTLWQPIIVDQSKVTHKRVNDLRRMNSVI